MTKKQTAKTPVSKAAGLQIDNRRGEFHRRDLMDAANSIILRWTPDGVVRYINDFGLRFFGYTAQEVVGKNIMMLVPAHDSLTGTDLTRLAENIATDPNTYLFNENENLKKNGERAWVMWTNKAIADENGRLKEILCIGNDISELKWSKELVKTSEKRYRNLFSAMTEGFALHEILLDEKGAPCDYRFLDVNPAFEKLTGLKREDIIGKTVLEALPGTDSTWIEKYGKVALSGEPVHFDNYFPPLDKHYEVYAYRPEPMKFAVIFMDITGRRESEEVLRRDKKMLEQLVNEQANLMVKAQLEVERNKRLSDIGQLAATIAHELRNPLVAIKMAAYNIKRKAANPKLDKHIDTINKKIAESDLIIQNVLSFGKTKVPHFEEVRLLELVQENINTVTTKYLDWKVELRKNILCPDGCVLEADF
jgi:two-component system sensor histidine kinase/response regulator